jgi:hypothetical protein
MQALVRVGYPYLIHAHHLHPVVWGAVSTLLRSRAQGTWEGLHVAPSLCPSRRAQLCTYFWWLRRPAHVARLSLFGLIVDARRLRVSLRFRMGVHGSTIDVGRWRGLPRSQRTCDMCDKVLWGTSTTLCSSARLYLRLGRTRRRCLRLGPGLCVRLFGSLTFLMLYGTFTTVSRFVLGSSISVLVFPRISLIWLD